MKRWRRGERERQGGQPEHECSMRTQVKERMRAAPARLHTQHRDHLMLWGYRRRQAAVRPPRRARFGAAGEWASVRRRRRGLMSRMPAVAIRPRPSAEPVSVAERDYFRRPAFHVRVGAVGLVATTLFAILF